MREKDPNKKPKIELGEHWLAEFINCDRDKLMNAETVEKIMLEAAKEANATIISQDAYQFKPFGASAMVFIAESHISIHTWPEYKMAAVDIFTCGDEMDAKKGIRALKDRLGAEEVVYKKIIRGV